MQENNFDLNDLREENCLYRVVDRGLNGIYLQNTRNNRIFEEPQLLQEMQDAIGIDYILRYQNGKYIIEEEITDDFFNSMIGIEEYEEIQNDFIKKSNISEIDSDTPFSVISRKNDYTVLLYEDTTKKQIEVPNALLPYFIDNDTILYYKNGKFEKR